MADNVEKSLLDALVHLKFPSAAFGVAFGQALKALVEDADASSYIPGPGNENAFDNLIAVLEDMDDTKDWETDDDDDDDIPDVEELEFDEEDDIEDEDDDDDDDFDDDEEEEEDED